MKGINSSLRMVARLVFLILLCAHFSLSAFATKDLNTQEVELPNFSWEVDLETMSSATDNKGSSDYSLSVGGSAAFSQFGEFKTVSIRNSNGTYFINDRNNILDDYETFYVEADMFFEQYPTGTASGGTQTAQNYPMSFVTWMTLENGNNNYNYRSIRINHEGYLCTGNSPEQNPDQITSVKLPLGEWFKIRFAINPSTGKAEIYINGESVLIYSPGSPKIMVGSKIRFFDTRYKYSVHLKNISACSDSDFLIGLTDEETVNYLAYQTTQIDTVNNKKCFDLRVVAGLNSLEYSCVGYDVIVFQERNGVLTEREINLTTTEVYDSVRSDHIRVSAAEYGVEYLAALAINDIWTDPSYVEIIIKPYAVKNNIRIFGDSMYLTWRGAVENGYPIFSYSPTPEQYSTSATEDTYTKTGTASTSNFGTSTIVELKNNGLKSNTTRYAYFKFNFDTEIAKQRLSTAGKVYFEFYVKSARTLTAEEQAAGGIPVNVYGINNDWSQTELTYALESSQITSSTLITQARFKSGMFCQVDVTDYVIAHINDGEVSFKLANVADDGSGGQTSIYSSESSLNQPRLVVQNTLYNQEINLTKLLNKGYEPWGYAEMLVDNWIENERDELYAHGQYDTVDLEVVDITSPSGAYTNPFMKYANNPTSQEATQTYVRNLDSLINNGFTKSDASEYDIYGGITNSGIKGRDTGIFHLEKINGREYIIDPLGNPFFSVGINTAQMGSTQHQKDAALEKYKDSDNFYSSVAAEMRQIGINTFWGGDDDFTKTAMLCKAAGLSCTSGYMGTLGLSVSTGGSAKYLHNNTMNVFDPDFVAFCQKKADTTVSRYLTGDLKEYKSFLLGFYSDNEIPSQANMLYCYLTIDPNEPVNAYSYATAWTYLAKRTGKVNPSIDDITPELSEEFKAFVYARYFKCVTDALDNAGAQDYMYLGNRIHSTNMTSEGYLRAASKYVDIISANLYGGVQPPVETILTMYKYSGKPFLVTEFFSKAKDAVDLNGYSLGNQANAGLIVDTQADRALMYQNYTLMLIESQTCVGWTWYRFRDNDQTIFIDAEGNKYRAFDYRDSAISAYVNVDTNEKVELSKMPEVTIFHKGEKDTSNLGSNKGIYDNHMNIYPELTASIKLITDNIFGLVNYFDQMHK